MTVASKMKTAGKKVKTGAKKAVRKVGSALKPAAQKVKSATKKAVRKVEKAVKPATNALHLNAKSRSTASRTKKTGASGRAKAKKSS
jgi:hypothetical protein